MNVGIVELTGPTCLAEGESYNLQCVSEGYPVPDITFTFDGAPVPSDDLEGYTKTHYDTLVITGVQRVHGGVYRCNGDNGITRASSAASRLDYCSSKSRLIKLAAHICRCTLL